ncbi:lipopolysaccharide biosynthesis protein [Dinghuibacter silviterrae]|uniref:Subunit length determinant protein n=1 Tax=Dinghuibacter silviterrae TaxID=1539049 RepID=A0A4R8DRS4_9BACT|nr:lipopolysaccharide biosynthesis protein [Dinghuibacter silviterrae]TDX00057.1 hypothetical protein EDB95_1073 [Dinghuibacter silviterrae]
MSVGKNEISLKEIILRVGEWVRYLVSKWLILLIAGIAGGGIGLAYAFLKQPTYTGALTFVLSNESRAGGLSSIAGQFGIDIGSEGENSGAFEGENITQLLKSERIIRGAIFKTVPPRGTLLINLIGEKSGLFRRWMQNERVSGLIPFSADTTVPIQDSLISVLHGYIMKNYLDISKPDKKLSFYLVSATTPDEDISIYLTRYLVEEAAHLYIETKTATAKANLDMLQHEADSLRIKLEGAIYSTANKVDNTFNLNPALQVQRAPVQQHQIQSQVLGTAYGEVIRNLEIAKITLQKEMPLYQIIDEPRTPLVRMKFGKLKGIILGGLIAGILCAIVLLVANSFKEMMKSSANI